MYLLFIWGGTKWFWGGTIHNEGHFRGGGGPKNRDFFGPLNGMCAASAIWTQKSREVHTTEAKSYKELVLIGVRPSWARGDGRPALAAPSGAAQLPATLSSLLLVQYLQCSTEVFVLYKNNSHHFIMHGKAGTQCKKVGGSCTSKPFFLFLVWTLNALQHSYLVKKSLSRAKIN